MGLNYAQRTAEEKRNAFISGETIGTQRTLDMVEILLTMPEYTGGRPWSPEKIQKFVDEGFDQLYDYFYPAYTFDVEADVKQEEMDSILRKIWKDKFQTFYERYTEFKKILYNKPRKGWR